MLPFVAGAWIHLESQSTTHLVALPLVRCACSSISIGDSLPFHLPFSLLSSLSISFQIILLIVSGSGVVVARRVHTALAQLGLQSTGGDACSGRTM